MYLDVGVVAVGLARQQRLDLLATGIRCELAQHGLAFLDGGLVFFRFAEFDQRDCIVEIALELLKGCDGSVQRLALAHHLLRGLRVIPELGIFGALVQLGQAFLRGIPVKDASAAASGTGGRRRQVFRLRPAWAAS